MKICSKCKQNKPEDQYHKAKNGKNGLRSYCKECAKKQKNDWYRANRSAYGGDQPAPKASYISKRQKFVAKYGKDIDDIINNPEPERHDLSEFFD